MIVGGLQRTFERFPLAKRRPLQDTVASTPLFVWNEHLRPAATNHFFPRESGDSFAHIIEDLDVPPIVKTDDETVGGVQQ